MGIQEEEKDIGTENIFKAIKAETYQIYWEKWTSRFMSPKRPPKGWTLLTPKAKATKAKISKWEYIKPNTFLHSQKNNQHNEKATYQLKENIFKSNIW